MDKLIYNVRLLVNDTLVSLSKANSLVINSIIYPEVFVGFEKIEDLEDVSDPHFFRHDQIP